MTAAEIKKAEFIRMCKGAKTVLFQYSANGNDPCNPCGTVKKQATYEFYAIIDGNKKLIVYKNHRRSHDIVQAELENKYSHWAKIALNSNPQP